METIVMILTLLGGSQSNQSFDPSSLVVKQLVKGVYDKTKVQEEKNVPHFIDKIRILE
jgi:hypothetical protein